MNKQPTIKQLQFIKVIEEKWGYGKFKGSTEQEANEYISECINEQLRYEMEIEYSNYGAPNQ